MIVEQLVGEGKIVICSFQLARAPRITYHLNDK